MAHETRTSAAQPGLALEISAAVHHLMQRLGDMRDYYVTVRDLHRLNDATLADLGIARSDIETVARKAVYGV